MYASETWATTTKERSRLQAAEMRVVRLIGKKTRRDKIRNDVIRGQVGIAKLQNKIDSAQLRWLGHLERMDDGRVAKRRWEWRPNGRRPRGRPRKRWSDAVEETLARHQLPHLQELRDNGILENRNEWRRRLAPLTEREALPGS